MNSTTSYLNLPKALYSKVFPTPVNNPKLMLWNEELAKELSIDYSKDTSLEIFSGNEIMEGSIPVAQAYAGHQFGHFSILGDGRAILLGEQITTNGNRVDVQLKGAGPTPYSRRGDGRGTLYSMLREYLISESMHGLGIPTSRSLAVVSSGENVRREQIQAGGVLTRIAASHLRIGTFEFVARTQTISEVKALADYAIQRHYPDLKNESSPYLSFYNKVMKQQISTVVNWLRVGFIHGVMNTDNITISGETIDYGPCAFMNGYDPHTVFSSIDTQSRYAFGNQGRILLWNLARLAETLLPLFNDNQDKALAFGQEAIDSYESLYDIAYNDMLSKKFGFVNEQEGDDVLITSFMDWMQNTKADYTNSFLSLESELIQHHLTEHKSSQNLSTVKFIKSDHNGEQVDKLNKFLSAWMKRIGNDIKGALTLMQISNPRVIPRNKQVEIALTNAASHNEFDQFNTLLKVMSSPYDLSLSNLELQSTSPTDDANYQTFCGT